MNAVAIAFVVLSWRGSGASTLGLSLPRNTKPGTAGTTNSLEWCFGVPMRSALYLITPIDRFQAVQLPHAAAHTRDLLLNGPGKAGEVPS